MRSIFFFTLSLIAMTTSHAQFSDKRLLLIFGAAQSSPVQHQLDGLNKAARGLQERDLQVVLAAEKQSLYKQYRVAATAPFLLLLVGKDGGVKYRSLKPVPPDTIFNLIDAMPMRQSELRSGKNQ